MLSAQNFLALFKVFGALWAPMALIYLTYDKVILSCSNLFKIALLLEKFPLDLLVVHFENGINWHEKAMLVLAIKFDSKTSFFTDT